MRQQEQATREQPSRQDVAGDRAVIFCINYLPAAGVIQFHQLLYFFTAPGHQSALLPFCHHQLIPSSKNHRLEVVHQTCQSLSCSSNHSHRPCHFLPRFRPPLILVRVPPWRSRVPKFRPLSKSLGVLCLSSRWVKLSLLAWSAASLAETLAAPCAAR